MILYTLVPIGVMILYGFNQAPSGRLTFAWKGFTLDWYRQLFDIPDLTTALVHSLEIAALSTLIAVAVGTPAALALARYRFRGRGLSDLVILADIAAPSVVVGASLLGFFVYFGIPRGFGTILIAHVAFNIAFVVVVIQARRQGPRPVARRRRRRPRRQPVDGLLEGDAPADLPRHPRRRRCSRSRSRSTTSSSPASSPARR